MNPELCERQLEQAESAVASGERHIARQRQFTSDLEALGIDTNRARDLLARFKSLQVLHVAHRDRLHAELKIGAGNLVLSP
jgi:hypothetical protein